MPIKKRNADKRNYVFVTPDGGLQIKTPAPCTKWDQEFRLRIVRDYVPPRTLRSIAEHKRLLQTLNNEDKTYRIGGKLLRVRHPTENIDQPNYTVILRTDVQNLSSGKEMFLRHPDPAMRILMVYTFLTGEDIYGVPDLQIADIDKGC